MRNTSLINERFRPSEEPGVEVSDNRFRVIW